MSEQYGEADDIREYWDARHREWIAAPNWGNYPYMQNWFRERFAHLLPAPSLHPGLSLADPLTTHVLDFGCGGGLYAAPLLEHFDYYWGFDTSAAAIEVANLAYMFDPQRSRMSFALYTGKPGDYVGGLGRPYDCVISITVLQHQPGSYRLAMVENIKSLLAPKGKYIGLEWIGGTAAYDMPAMDEAVWREAWLPREIVFDVPPGHPDWVANNVWYTR